jgi:pimeloyl-ACP methyl ester carboxylesterase
VAQYLALTYPDLVGRLILASSGAREKCGPKGISIGVCMDLVEKGYERSVRSVRTGSRIGSFDQNQSVRWTILGSVVALRHKVRRVPTWLIGRNVREIVRIAKTRTPNPRFITPVRCGLDRSSHARTSAN